MSLENKVAIVTGGTSGIGRETAIQFASAGAKVVIAGRREAEGNAVVDTIVKAGGTAMFVQTDIADEGQVKNLIEETVQNYGRLDIAFNNAGVEMTGPLVDMTEADYHKTFDINVLGVILSMKYEIPAMLKSGAARSSILPVSLVTWAWLEPRCTSLLNMQLKALQNPLLWNWRGKGFVSMLSLPQRLKPI